MSNADAKVPTDFDHEVSGSGASGSEVQVADTAPEPEPAPASRPLTEPADGVPPVTTAADFAAVVAALAAGTGPVAIDAERASGYRYSARAYLVQLRRADAGTFLIDPIEVPDFSALDAALADTEWVLHAASQDIPSLRMLGMNPRDLFDTELAGRLLNLPRVGLGPLLEAELGVSLAKEHSAADWSTRPLPDSWLRYAALDVELLVELRDILAKKLEAEGKAEWAAQEFAAVVAAPPASPRVDPWRRVSGLHRVRDRQRLAVVASLWTERDRSARARDIAPGRVLPDFAIVEAALSDATTAEELGLVPGFTGRGQRRIIDRWFGAVLAGRNTPRNQWPAMTIANDGPPPARSWADRDPAAAARLTAARTAVADIAHQHNLPVENLLTPDSLRRLCWTPPEPLDLESVQSRLAGYRARPWQIALCAAPLLQALNAPLPATVSTPAPAPAAE